jgi:hypothetical protein
MIAEARNHARKAEIMTSSTDGTPPRPPARAATRLVSGGRHPFAHHGFVNPPVYQASTVLYPTAEDFLAHRGPMR